MCETQDVKGLYRKARSGEIPNMTSIRSPYEAPEQPDLRLYGAGASPEQAVPGLLERVLEAGNV